MMNTDSTQDGAEPSGASAGIHWSASAFEAWAARHGLQCRPCGSHYFDMATEWAWLGWKASTLTDEEREAIQRAIDSQQHRAAEMHSRSWAAAAIDDDCDTLRGMLERLG